MSLASTTKLHGTDFNPECSSVRIAHDQPYEKDEDVKEEDNGPEVELYVVILAGGFNSELAKDILRNAQEAEHDDELHAKVLMLRGKEGEQRVPLAVCPLDNHHSLQHTLHCLRQVERFEHLNRHVYIVCNEVDYGEFAGHGGLITDGSDLHLHASNVISNGCRSAADWRGEVEDLQAAIRRLGTDKHILAMSSRMVFWPEYNFQRLVEHSMVRGQNVLAFTRLTDTDLRLRGSQPHDQVALAGQQPLGPISAVLCGLPAQKGMLSACPLAVLRRNRLQEVLGSSATDLVQLMTSLTLGGPLCGLDLGWGCFFIDRLLPYDYCNQLFQWRSGTMNRIVHVNSKRSYDVSVQLGSDDNELGSNSLHDRRSYTDQLKAQLENCVATHFDRLFFEQQATKFLGLRRPFYKLPPTFYMTQYRCMAASIVPRKESAALKRQEG